MLLTYLGKGRRHCLSAKALHGIGAEQAERPGDRQFIPERFQADGSFLIALRPEEGDHLSEDTHTPGPRRSLSDHPPYRLLEGVRFRRTVAHKARQRFGGILRKVLLVRA